MQEHKRWDGRGIMVRRAQQLRREGTRSEEILWEALRDRRFQGIKFRRQQVLGRFIADFYAASHHLVVEVDGGIHDEQPERDTLRDAWMQSRGLRVFRLPAALIEQSLGDSLALLALHLATLDEPSPPPLREVGEGAGG